MILATQGAELCATHSDDPNPQPTSCVSAYDETYKGKVDLSARVEIGDPVQKSSLHWSVPYNVKDDAGNKARTVWRDVVVTEVSIHQLEAKLRKDVEAEKEAAVKEAVKKAIEEHKKNETKLHHLEHLDRGKKKKGTCPPCPKCGGSPAASRRTAKETPPKFDESMCDKICEERAQHCAFREDSYVIKFMLWMEGFLPSSSVPLAMGIVMIAFTFIMARLVLTFLFNPDAFSQGYDYATNDERYRSMQNSVTYYQGSTPQQANRGPTVMGVAGASGGMNGGGAPPRASMSTNPTGEFFLTPQAGTATFSSANGIGAGQAGGTFDDIYQTPSPITPRRGGDAFRKRSPYDFQN